MKRRRTDGDLQLYAQVLENIEDAVIAVDNHGRISLFNPAAQLFFGISERQSLRRPYADLLRGQENLLHLIGSVLKQGRSISDHANISIERSTGSTLRVSVSVSPLFTRNGDQEGVVLILRDLSRLRELEENLRRADRLSILGTLAAGLAHEVKNPLGGIKGAAQLLEMELGSASPLKEYTAVMVREVERVNGIIEELMDLARPRPPQMGPVHLARILNDLVLFQKEAHRGKCLDFVLQLDPSIPPFRGDEGLLTRLFLNLIKNAAEAIERQGRIDIITKVAPEYHMNSEGGRPTPLIVIEVRDNGRGIPPEHIDQIFTPFFTSKDRGSGLGLATCLKIVNEHDGYLKVESTPGLGTAFSVYLPYRR